jgi:hypothetical protein
LKPTFKPRVRRVARRSSLGASAHDSDHRPQAHLVRHLAHPPGRVVVAKRSALRDGRCRLRSGQGLPPRSPPPARPSPGPSRTRRPAGPPARASKAPSAAAGAPGSNISTSISARPSRRSPRRRWAGHFGDPPLHRQHRARRLQLQVGGGY